MAVVKNPRLGPERIAVLEHIRRAGRLSAAEITDLASAWRPSLVMLSAQAVALKIARRTKLGGPADAAFEMAYGAVRSAPDRPASDWENGGSAAAYAALALALGRRLPPEASATLSGPWRSVVTQ